MALRFSICARQKFYQEKTIPAARRPGPLAPANQNPNGKGIGFKALTSPRPSPLPMGAEREKRSPLLWNDLRLDLPDGHLQNRKRELPFLLPGGEGQDEDDRKTIIHFSETPNCAGRRLALLFQFEWLTKSKLPQTERIQKNSASW